MTGLLLRLWIELLSLWSLRTDRISSLLLLLLELLSLWSNGIPRLLHRITSSSLLLKLLLSHLNAPSWSRTVRTGLLLLLLALKDYLA